MRVGGRGVGCADLPAGGAFGEELRVGLGGLLPDLAGAVELVHGGRAEGAEDGGVDRLRWRRSGGRCRGVGWR